MTNPAGRETVAEDVEKLIKGLRQKCGGNDMFNHYWTQINLEREAAADALASLTPGKAVGPGGEENADAISTNDVRWAVNVLLEKIAKNLERWPTWDIWRSDAAMVVRSFKYPDATPAQPEQAAPGKAVEQLAKLVNGTDEDDPATMETARQRVLATRDLLASLGKAVPSEGERAALELLKLAIDREGWPAGWNLIRKQVEAAISHRPAQKA